MYKVGITGGIGSGKTTVCKIFEVLGVPVYYADVEAKKLYDNDYELKELIIKHFGKDVYSNDKFDRLRMREIIYNNDDKLALLNSLVHPLVIQHANEWMKQQTHSYSIKEAALMIESGSSKELDKLILVSCPVNLRIERVSSRDQLAPEEVMARIEKQLPEEIMREHADFEIVNDESLLLIPQVEAIHSQLLMLANQQRQQH
jgi:dephospho-CoA kinase